MNFKAFNVSDNNGNSNCVIRSLCKIYNKKYNHVYNDLCNICKELNCESYNDIDVFETYMNNHNTKEIQYGKDLQIKNLNLDNGKYMVFCWDKNKYYHMVSIIDNVLYDKDDNSLNLYVIKIYKDNDIQKKSMNDIKTPNDLLTFMSKINYGYLGKNGRVYHYDDDDFNSQWYEQYILESKNDILENLCGNCWDQVELERYWFLKNGYKIKTIYEMVKLDYDNEYPTHSFLVYKDKANWYWFENADFNNRGIHKFNNYDELLSYQYKQYIKYLKTFNISDEEINKIIITEFDKPKEHISAEEYLNHVINSQMIYLHKN